MDVFVRLVPIQNLRRDRRGSTRRKDSAQETNWARNKLHARAKTEKEEQTMKRALCVAVLLLASGAVNANGSGCGQNR